MTCRVLGVRRQGYYEWRSGHKSVRAQENELLLKHIERIHVESRRTYGWPRVHAELTLGLGQVVNHKRVARLMREADIQGASTGADDAAARSETRARSPTPTWSTGTSPSTARTNCG